MVVKKEQAKASVSVDEIAVEALEALGPDAPQKVMVGLGTTTSKETMEARPQQTARVNPQTAGKGSCGGD